MIKWVVLVSEYRPKDTVRQAPRYIESRSDDHKNTSLDTDELQYRLISIVVE